MVEQSEAGEIGLLYVSLSSLRLPEQAGDVAAIVDWSRVRNRELDVTGALVFTEKRFAQYLEGPAAAVDELMRSISRDPRHRDIQVAVQKEIPRRRLATWALAYAGPSTFVASHVLAVADATAPAVRGKYAERLIDTMAQFVGAQLIEQRRRQGS